MDKWKWTIIKTLWHNQLSQKSYQSWVKMQNVFLTQLKH